VLSDDVFYSITVGRLGVHRAGAALRAAAFPWFVPHHPAGTIGGFIRGTGHANVLRARLDLPAGEHGEESPDTGDADLLVIDRLAQAAYTMEIRFGIKTVLRRLPDGEDQALTLIQAECRDRQPDKVCCFAD
jgi:hypothetical protein